MHSTPDHRPADTRTKAELLAAATSPKDSPFDYIIVGSGAGGGPLACRLAEKGRKVLLIEAGPDPKSAGVVHDAPLFHGAATEDKALSWQFSVRHYEDTARQAKDHKYDPARDPASAQWDPNQAGSPATPGGKGGVFYPRSSGLGGCTGHHAMIVIRPNDGDWEHIAELTNDDSWRAMKMQPYFAKFERCLYLDEYRGFLARLFGLFSQAFFALMRFVNPRAVLDEGGHGREGWQPTSFISPPLIKKIVKTDNQFAKVIIQSAFRTIQGNSPLTAFLKRVLLTFGFVRVFDPNDRGTRAESAEGVFLIPTGIGGAPVSQRAGIAPLLDENGNSLQGRRAGVREFILKTQEAYPDRLVIAQGVQVKRLIFDDTVKPPKPPRAIGVEGAQGENLYQASPLRQSKVSGEVKYYVRPGSTKAPIENPGEVILCGGAFNTPQLLMLSGIGDRDHLNEINEQARKQKQQERPRQEQGQEGAREAIPITVRVHLPGVGANLQDRYEIGVVSEMCEDFKSLDTLSFDPTETAAVNPNDPAAPAAERRVDKLLEEWRRDKTGLYSTNGGSLAIVQRSKAADGPEPDLFTFGAPAAFRGYYWNWSKELLRPLRDTPNRGTPNNQCNLWTWVILKAYTRNQGGTVRLRSADPFDTPDICFHSFDDPDHANEGWEKDVTALEEAVDTMRRLNASSGSPFRREIQPEDYLAEHQCSLKDWIKNEAWGHHACGTCRIGGDPWRSDPAQLNDKRAVLSSDFRVHGVQGLRVVDASVFPKIPGYFILAPIFMVSEKAADTILAESVEEGCPVSIREFEADAIRVRRRAAWVTDNNEFVAPDDLEARERLRADPSAGGKNRPVANVVGLALSGGGIRSATFSIGVLQALAKKGRLRHVDYLSTISGGGFTGSFLGRLFTRAGVRNCADPAGRVEELLKEQRSSPLRWLRTQANYLFASGTDDWLTALGIFFRSVLSVHLVVGALLLFVFGVLAGVSQHPLYRAWAPAPPGPDRWFGLVPSSWWWTPLAVLGLVVIPIKLAYWLARKRMSYRAYPPHEFAAWLIVMAGASIAIAIPGGGTWAGAILVMFGLALVWLEASLQDLPDSSEARCLDGVIARNRLTRGLGDALVIFVALVGWVVLDSVARTVASRPHLPEMIGTLVALSPTLQLLRTWAMKVAPTGDGPRPITRLKVTAVAIAVVLLFLVDVIALSLFQGGDSTLGWAVVLVALLVSLALGRAFDFLNLTSLHSAYSARIVRTFLGASNSARTANAANLAADVQVAHPDDDLPHHEYRPEKHGGPLHLISVCLNETVDHASQREIRERKGLLMTVGSFGVSVGRRFFARWSPRVEAPCWLRWRRWLEGLNRTIPTPPALEAIRADADPNSFHPLGRRDKRPAVVAALSLGEWVAISGAAFSTGRGRASSPLEALFMGLCNFRLGYWWDSGVRASERPGRFPANLWRRIKGIPATVCRMQYLLLAEWRARFHGPSHEFWNLTDGGHLDNSAAYELIRRRVEFIILVDATSDPNYSFDALAALERDIRIDFDAEISWQPNPKKVPPWIEKWIHPSCFGPLDELRPDPSRRGLSHRHATVAQISYRGQASVSWLLLIKATLDGTESRDVTQYARTHAAFPQESTTDQFYDDEQWESYRRLGVQAGDAILPSQPPTLPPPIPPATAPPS